MTCAVSTSVCVCVWRGGGGGEGEGGMFQTMYLWWSLCTLYLLACQVRVTVGGSGLCYCVV